MREATSSVVTRSLLEDRIEGEEGGESASSSSRLDPWPNRPKRVKRKKALVGWRSIVIAWAGLVLKYFRICQIV